MWTGTTAAGVLWVAGNTCSNWTSEAGVALWGYPDNATGAWTIACQGGSCAWQEPIYCFQQ